MTDVQVRKKCTGVIYFLNKTFTLVRYNVGVKKRQILTPFERSFLK